MKKLIIFLSLLVILSISLGILLSRVMTDTNRVERAGFFSTETRAVCEELKQPDCYYRCHDELFLILNGKEISLYKYDEYVCHEEGWVDPRIK